MGVTTTKTNKPFNPRAQDQSPLAYNRAALYSGKALDFDGVNDYVDLDGFTMAGNVATISFHLKADDWDVNSFIFAAGTPEIVLGSTTGGNNLSFYDSSSWQTFGAISDTTSTNFFSIVFSGTSAIAYMNGVKFGNTLTITPINVSSVTGVKLMSKYTGDAFFFNGQIAGFKIFNTALTAAQIADLYNFPEKIVPTGVDNTALKLWLPMMESAGTTAFNGAPDALGSEEVTNGDFSEGATDWLLARGWSVSNNTLINDGSVTTAQALQEMSINGTAGTIYALTFNVLSATNADLRFYSPNVGYVSQTINTGDSVTYLLESDGSYNYLTGRNYSGAEIILDNLSVKELTNYGTISGATWTNGIGAPVAQTSVIDWNKHTLDGTNSVLIPQGLTTGRDLLGNLFENVRKQSALNLDGQSWAEVHDNESFDLTDLSLECWFYADSSAASDGLLGQWSGSQGYLLYLVSSSDVRFFINGTARVYSTALTGWNHIVGVYDGATMKLYINGTQEVSGAHTTDPVSANVPLEIGRFGESVGTQYPNQIAQPRIYNRALSAEEVQRNYNAGKNIYS